MLYLVIVYFASMFVGLLRWLKNIIKNSLLGLISAFSEIKNIVYFKLELSKSFTVVIQLNFYFKLFRIV